MPSSLKLDFVGAKPPQNQAFWRVLKLALACYAQPVPTSMLLVYSASPTASMGEYVTICLDWLMLGRYAAPLRFQFQDSRSKRVLLGAALPLPTILKIKSEKDELIQIKLVKTSRRLE
jgi:hypothetical protein